MCMVTFCWCRIKWPLLSPVESPIIVSDPLLKSYFVNLSTDYPETPLACFVCVLSWFTYYKSLRLHWFAQLILFIWVKHVSIVHQIRNKRRPCWFLFYLSIHRLYIIMTPFISIWWTVLRCGVSAISEQSGVKYVVSMSQEKPQRIGNYICDFLISVHLCTKRRKIKMYEKVSYYQWTLWVMSHKYSTFIQRLNMPGKLIYHQVFPKLYKFGNVVNKSFHGEEQNKFSQKIAPSGDQTQDTML